MTEPAAPPSPAATSCILAFANARKRSSKRPLKWIILRMPIEPPGDCVLAFRLFASDNRKMDQRQTRLSLSHDLRARVRLRETTATEP